MEEPGRDEAVAAIVAGPAEHGDRAGIGEAPCHLIGDAAASIFHEDEAGHPTLNGETIGRSHLFRSQKLKHEAKDSGKGKMKGKDRANAAVIALILCIVPSS